MKKFWLFSLVFIILAFLATPKILAYVSSGPLEEGLKKPTWNKESFDFGSINNVAQTLTIDIIGAQDPELNKKLGSSAIGSMTNLIAIMYANPPASSVEYFADLGKNLKIIKPAYAQGIGFEGLKPILPIWKAFRNLAYLFFVIIFVAIGFAIMFRLKLNPQTVISIQTAIPRIVMALILVTFSYAIAGLMIDLIYIGINVVITVISAPSVGLIKDANILRQQYLSGGLPALAGAVFSGGLRSLNDIYKAFFAPIGILTAITTIIGTLVFPGWGTAVGLFGGAVLPILILAVVLLFAFFRIFFSLLMAYIQIILSIIFAPLQLMLSALPGQNSFEGWLRNLLANILVFPAVALMLLIGTLLTQSNIGDRLWSPPMIATGGVANAAAALIGLGILLITPKAADMVREALQVKPSPYIGEALAPFRPITAIPSTAAQYGIGELSYKYAAVPGPVGKISGFTKAFGIRMGLWK